MFARLATAGLLALAGVTALPSAANASSSGTLSTHSGVIWSDCRQHSYDYSLSLEPDATYWNLDVTVLGPDGLEVGSDYLYDGNDPTAGTSGFQVCGYSDPGQWTLTATLEYYVDETTRTTELEPVQFSMRLPQTRTALRASDRTLRHGQVFVLTIRTRDERPAGYFPTRYAEVRLQKKVSGSWVRVPGGKAMTNREGVAKLKFRYMSKGNSRVRAVTRGDALYAGSVSPTLTLTRVRG